MSELSERLANAQRRARLQNMQSRTVPAEAEFEGPPRADMSFMGRVRDNIIGVDDGVMSTGEKIGNLINQGGEAMTLGIIGDEADAAAAAAIPGGMDYDQRLAYMRSNQAQMEEEHPVLSTVAKVAPALIPGVGMARMAQGGTMLARASKGGAMGAGAGGIYGFMEGEGGAGRRASEAGTTAAISGVIGAGLPVVTGMIGGFIKAGLNRRARSEFIDSAPTVENLIERASAKYDEAAARGVSASPQRVGQLVENIGDLLRREGVVSPLGRISQAYPKVANALDMLGDYAEDAMTPEHMQQVRKLLQSAARSADGQEARIGTQMLKAFDDFVEPLAPQFREANQLYRQAMNGKLIEEAVELAGVRAGQFTGSGFENALRTEFRRLSRDIVKGNLRGLSPDQVSLIRRVAEGAPLENTLRNMGKAAPRGPVSAAAGGGMPFLIGNAIGGPGVGLALSGGTMAAGEVGRRLATAAQRRNALAAGAAMRSGRALPVITSTPASVNYLSRMGFGAAPIGSNSLAPQQRAK